MTSCCEHHAASSVTQTLDEMDFERGLWSAALNGEMSRVRALLEQGREAGGLDSAGYTPLHYAARSGHADVCTALLAHGACANATTPAGHVTPLHRAAYCGHVSVIQTLLRHGADVTLRDADGQNALHKACGSDHTDVVRLLTAADDRLLQVKDTRGRTPRDCAAARDVIQLLGDVT